MNCLASNTNEEADFGICVTDCDCTYRGCLRSKFFKIRRGQLVKLHKNATNNVRLSTLDSKKILFTPLYGYFRVITSALYACLNAINDIEQRIQFYVNNENCDFVLNLRQQMTVLVAGRNYQLKAIFQTKVTIIDKIYFNLELLESPSRSVVEELKRDCFRYDHSKLELTVAANMIQKFILPNVIIKQKQLWLCGRCNQENLNNSKICRYCTNSTAGSYHSRKSGNNHADTNNLMADEKLAKEKYDMKSPRPYDDVIIRNEKLCIDQPTGIPKSGSSSKSNQFKHDNVATNQIENVYEQIRVSDDIIRSENKPYERPIYGRIKRSNENTPKELVDLESRLAWRCEYCDIENVAAQCTQCGQSNQASVTKRIKPTQWSCTVCFETNYKGFNCERCHQNRDEILIPSIYQIPFDAKIIVPEDSNNKISPNCIEVNKSKSHESIINENVDLMEYYGLVMVIQNGTGTNCMNCKRALDISKGFVLLLCNHTFCVTCIKTEVTKFATESQVDNLTCRALVNNIKCDRQFELTEIKYFLSKEIYEQFKTRLIDANETNSFIKMCYDTNCSGYYLCEEYYRTPPVEFLCNKCNLKNCLQCKLIHDGVNCMEYGKLFGDGKSIDKDTGNMLLNWIREGIAMPCPECNALIEKDEGCDWVQCSFCQTEICWATRGHRWGPGGNGDTSGGCGCTKEKKCVETCKYCH